MTAKDAVYTGFWTNWSEGRVSGATLTVSTRDSAYLVAFLALFVKLAGTNTWQFLSYVAFRNEASPHDLDQFKRKRLMVLRNIPSAFDALWELVKMSTPQNLRRRPVVLILAAAVHAAGFYVAGIFASAVTNTRSDVLLKPTQCGSWVLPQLSMGEKQNIQTAQFEEHLNRGVATSAQMAHQCYNSSIAMMENCNAYGRRLIEPTVSTSDKCPFAPSMCINDTSVQIDSGFVNSLHDLGINSHPKDSVSFRKTIECATIRTEGFTMTYSSKNLTSDAAKVFQSIGQDIQDDEFIAFFYGPNVAYQTNATFVFDTSALDTSVGSTLVPYRMHADSAWPNAPFAGSFNPIPLLERTDAEVLMLFLANAALYPKPVLDPWFHAQTPVVDIGKVTNYTLYAAEKPVSVLGCVDKTEICNPAAQGGQRCTELPWAYLSDKVEALTAELELTPRQVAVLGRFYEPIHNSIDVMSQIGADGGLLASSMTSNWLSAELPNNQWILELQHWFAVFLVSTQLRIVQYVSGLDDPAYEHWLTPPTDDEEWMCRNQIIQRKDHVSFSVLGLTIILCSGVLVFFLNLFLTDVRLRLCRRSSAARQRDKQWRSYELLELQLPPSTKGDNEEQTVPSRPSSVNTHIARGLESSTSGCSKRTSEETIVGRTEPKDDLQDVSTTAKIETELQQNDFPPEELARLISPRV